MAFGTLALILLLSLPIYALTRHHGSAPVKVASSRLQAHPSGARPTVTVAKPSQNTVIGQHNSSHSTPAPIVVTPTTPPPTPPSSPILWDYFQRPDGNLAGEMSPSGEAYIAQGPVPPVIKNGQYVDPASATQTGGAGFSALLMPFQVAPTIVSGKFVFTSGAYDPSNFAVLGACSVSLGAGSVQMWVSPTTWEVMTVTKSTPSYPAVPPNAVYYDILAKGKYSTSLTMDGQTTYGVTMSYDAASSSIAVTWPASPTAYQTQTFTSSDPIIGISADWGNRAFAQIQHGTTGHDLPAGASEVHFTAFGAN